MILRKFYISVLYNYSITAVANKLLDSVKSIKNDLLCYT